MTESESLARDIKEGTLSGFVGGGTMVTGEANFKAMMRVDGHLSGRVNSSSGTLIVGANGKVDANIEVAVAVIHGTINGDIIATQRLELGRAAKVNGNIQTPSLIIEQGAVFEGSCKMLQMATAADKARKETKETKVDEKPLDTSKMPTMRGDAAKPTEIPAVSSVVS
jgi:cytoskeletal protein CcmA (bactofilin family)